MILVIFIWDYTNKLCFLQPLQRAWPLTYTNNVHHHQKSLPIDATSANRQQHHDTTIKHLNGQFTISWNCGHLSLSQSYCLLIFLIFTHKAHFSIWWSCVWSPCLCRWNYSFAQGHQTTDCIRSWPSFYLDSNWVSRWGAAANYTWRGMAIWCIMSNCTKSTRILCWWNGEEDEASHSEILEPAGYSPISHKKSSTPLGCITHPS